MYRVTTSLSREKPTMFASDLTAQHIGHDLTLTVGGVCTGGIIESVGSIFGMVSVTLDGQTFNIDEDMPVTLTLLEPGRRLLNEPDPKMRKQYYDQMDARGVYV